MAGVNARERFAVVRGADSATASFDAHFRCPTQRSSHLGVRRISIAARGYWTAIYDCAVPGIRIAIVTFTKTEESAVRQLLTSLFVSANLLGATVWKPTSFGGLVLEGELSDGSIARIEHRSLIAQGNVIAATELSRAATTKAEDQADYYVFYGCCGATDPRLIGEVFRVATVSYMSLGVVIDSGGGEVVKLKNKWIVHTTPKDQLPLETIDLPAGSPGTPGFATGLRIPTAHVLATDKVVKRAPGGVPQPAYTGPTGPVYAKAEWTYSEAIAQYADIATGPVLIDMESFGVASIMRAAALDERVIILRVVTAALQDKTGQPDGQQEELLRAGVAKLARVLGDILGV